MEPPYRQQGWDGGRAPPPRHDDRSYAAPPPPRHDNGRYAADASRYAAPDGGRYAAALDGMKYPPQAAPDGYLPPRAGPPAPRAGPQPPRLDERGRPMSERELRMERELGGRPHAAGGQYVAGGGGQYGGSGSYGSGSSQYSMPSRSAAIAAYTGGGGRGGKRPDDPERIRRTVYMDGVETGFDEEVGIRCHSCPGITTSSVTIQSRLCGAVVPSGSWHALPAALQDNDFPDPKFLPARRTMHKTSKPPTFAMWPTRKLA